jgi:hypothetical protein
MENKYSNFRRDLKLIPLMLAILLQSFAIYSQIPTSTDPLGVIDGNPAN